MESNRIWELIGKKLSGEATQEELKELEALMVSFPGSDFVLEEVEKVWRSGPPAAAFDPRQLEDKWKAFEKKLPYPEPEEEETADTISTPLFVNNRYRRLQVAAVGLLFLASGVLSVKLLRTNQKKDLRTNVIIAPAGAISQIKLPDGSKVWLNAGSKLTYQSQFGQNYREVSLVGEAFFDVIKDPEHPFIVTTSTLTLKVLGTAFNVRSFNKDRTSEAALVRGSIEVTLLHSPDKKIVLKPSEKLTVRNPVPVNNLADRKVPVPAATIDDLPLITISNVHYHKTDSLPAEAQWMEKKLVFDSESFEDLSHKMERFYNVKIVFENEAIKKLKFTGTFRDETIYGAMKALQNSSYFQFRIEENHITLNK